MSKQVSIPFSKLILKDRYSNFYWMFFSCFSFHLNITPYHPITRITLNVRKWSVQSWQLLHQWHQWSKYVPYLSLQLDGMLGWVSIRIWNGMPPPRKQTNDKLENSPWMSRCISYTIHRTGIFTYTYHLDTVRPMGYGKWVDLPASSSFVRFQGCKLLLLKMEVSHLECSIGDTVDGQNPAPVDR